jgi:hypothetical protein
VKCSVKEVLIKEREGSDSGFFDPDVLQASPAGDCLAVVTSQGLHTLNLQGSTYSAISVPGQAASAKDIEWNWNTGELYVSGPQGTISVFKH